MTQELSPELTAPEPEEGAVPRPGFLGWLGRRASALQPRSRRHWALYALLFLLALFVLYEWRSSVTYPTQVLVTEVEPGGDIRIGLSPYDPELLDFGDLSAGTQATVDLELENNSPISIRVSIVAIGSIRQFIKMSDAFFVLDPGEAKQVELSAAVPLTAKPKEYSGRIVVIRTPWFPWP